MSTTSSSSAGGGDTEYVYITKAQLEDVIETLDIARAAADDAKRMGVAVARQMYSGIRKTRMIEEDLAKLYLHNGS